MLSIKIGNVALCIAPSSISSQRARSFVALRMTVPTVRGTQDDNPDCARETS